MFLPPRLRILLWSANAGRRCCAGMPGPQACTSCRTTEEIILRGQTRAAALSRIGLRHP
jgi:hypothetical protein